MEWPLTDEELISVQAGLAVARPDTWVPPAHWSAGGCFACFGRGGSGPGEAGDRGWAGAALFVDDRPAAAVAVAGEAGRGYAPGLLALREGRMLEEAVRALPRMPDALLVNATGRDHPRRAGLALHLGAVLEMPTVGVTHRPLLARGDWPEESRGSVAPLRLHGELVGYWVRTRTGSRPLAVHPGWRTDPDVAVAVVMARVGRVRTPEPLRRARQVARRARGRQGPIP